MNRDITELMVLEKCGTCRDTLYINGNMKISILIHLMFFRSNCRSGLVRRYKRIKCLQVTDIVGKEIGRKMLVSLMVLIYLSKKKV